MSGDVAANLARIEAAAATAAGSGADILVTAEMATTGYNIGPLVTARAEVPDGPIATAIAECCRRLGIAIVFGYPEREGDEVFNAVQAIGPAGDVLAHYRKTHLFGELDRGLFAAGQRLVAQFPYGDLTCGLAICYDIEFPELARAHAAAGTDVLLVPTGLMAPFDVVARTLVPARAYESQMYVAYVNRCDREGELTFSGLSCVVGPDGADLVRGGAEESLLIADIDAATLAVSRALNTHLADRRLDLYPQEGNSA